MFSASIISMNRKMSTANGKKSKTNGKISNSLIFFRLKHSVLVFEGRIVLYYGSVPEKSILNFPCQNKGKTALVRNHFHNHFSRF